jgi:DNA (cytosine-5)-methyltransferase 1
VENDPEDVNRLTDHMVNSSFKASPTITASGGLIHWNEDRTLTVQELKRIQSLPDDFILTGSHSQQSERVGRMVPPLMMKAIAENIYKELLSKL